MDPLKSRADAVSVAVIAILNALGGFVGLPSWASAEGVLLLNGAVLSVAALVRFVLVKAAADAAVKTSV